MIEAKRYHPLLLLLRLARLIKNNLIIAFFLFIAKAGSDSTFIMFAKYAFILYFCLSFLYKIIQWFTEKYELDDRSFRLYSGVFSRSERTVPFSKVQNVNRHTSVFNRVFKTTSISFNTGSAGDDAEVKFEVISRPEAEKMESFVANREVNTAVEEEAATERIENIEINLPERTLHFKPTNKDLFKASFTSLSFLFLIPFLFSIYGKINEIVDMREEKLEESFSVLFDSLWMLAAIVLLFIIVSVGFGVTRTFLKYGKYEISSDKERIYISKGLVEESAFSISKVKVQAIEITQSPLKHLLGLAEVKLTSAGGVGIVDEKLEVDTLYPFLPKARAYEMITEILPDYAVKGEKEMTRLPKQSLLVRMFTPSWLWMIATGALYYFREKLFWDEMWWETSLLLLIVIYGVRLLDFLHTRYLLDEQFVQFRKGGLMTTMFVTKREKVIEVSVTRNRFQRTFGLASVETVNRAKPVRHEGIKDVPVELAAAFYNWYRGRTKEITTE
ncbi:PH domain-containing protein [Bacillus massilinigeriensis]|uniref:PH domain-containing protein n=1 Tax=Bacillus mediterraneensis TaxID=1805474 RepID=UPI0008F83F6F|nr:PH domain-containing protein [Bacillus mediterraneensis]